MDSWQKQKTKLRKYLLNLHMGNQKVVQQLEVELAQENIVSGFQHICYKPNSTFGLLQKYHAQFYIMLIAPTGSPLQRPQICHALQRRAPL